MQAVIHDQILQFPDGYDTLVGERGLKLRWGASVEFGVLSFFWSRQHPAAVSPAAPAAPAACPLAAGRLAWLAAVLLLALAMSTACH